MVCLRGHKYIFKIILIMTDQLPVGDIKEFTDEALAHIVELIQEKKISISKTAEFYGMPRNSFKYFMEKNGHPIPLQPKGSQHKIIDNEIKQLIIDNHSIYGHGATKTYYQLIHDISKKEHEPQNHSYNYIPAGIEMPSHRIVRNVFESENMYKFSRPPNYKAIGSSNYEALYSNMIWHVDIHFWGGHKESPIFALIDDYSRKIMGCELIENQKAETVLEVLKYTIAIHGKPYAIWSDNGSETKGEFNRYLQEEQIAHVLIRPRCPQQNGKIERYWPFLEKQLKEGKSIEEAVDVYNDSPHISLKYVDDYIRGKKYQRHQTPNERYEEGPMWNPNETPQWVVNGEIRPFNIGK